MMVSQRKWKKYGRRKERQKKPKINERHPVGLESRKRTGALEFNERTPWWIDTLKAKLDYRMPTTTTFQ